MVSDANFFDLTDSQRKLLGQTYAKFARPDDAIVEKLVELTGLNRAIVMAWFQNERKKEKKKHLEEQKKVEKLMWQGEKKLASSDSSSFSELSYESSSSSDEQDSSSEEEEDEKRKGNEKIRQKTGGKKIVELAGESLLRDKNEEEKKKRMIEAEELAGKLQVGSSLVQRNWQQSKNKPNWNGQERNDQDAVGNIKNNNKLAMPMPSAPSTSSSMVEQQNGRRAAGTQQKAKSAAKMPFVDERHKMIVICKMIVACCIFLFLYVAHLTIVTKGNGGKIIWTVKCLSGLPEEEQFYDLEHLKIMTIEDTIRIEPLNATHFLEEFVERKSNDGLAGGGFRWELAVRGRQAQISRSRLLIVVLRAWPKWATTDEGEHYMANATVKFTVAPKWSLDDETISTVFDYFSGNSHNRHCIFSSQNGGQCGVVFPNFDKILQRPAHFGDHVGDFHFFVKAAIEMKIPATTESIERL